MVLIDTQGQIVWYVATDLWTSGMHPYEWAREERTLLVGNAEVLQELALDGSLVQEWVRGVHFDELLHHDVARWGPYTYLLYDYVLGTVWVDGVYVFEGTTLLGNFRLEDHYTVSGGVGDWSHGNGLYVTEDGQAIFSTLSFSAAVAFDADPSSPTFLEHQFLATGAPNSLPDPDYTPLSADAGFGQQHAIHRVGDELWLFDNTGDGFRSRGLRLSLEHDRNGLAMLEEWPMGESCRAQGGAYPLDGGGMLATCAPSGDVWAFAAGQQAPVWTLNAWCGENEDSPIRFPKGVPITVQ